MQQLLLLAAGVLLLLSFSSTSVLVSAGGYGRGKPHRLSLYPREQWYFNHNNRTSAAAAGSTSAANNAAIPEAFDWCSNEGVNYCTPSWNQHIPRYCGSCWVHGTLSMIQDRLKIKKLRAGDTAPDVMLGRQTLLNCAAFKGYGAGCGGGEPLEVFKYMAEEGLPDESCLHYAATDHTLFKKKGRTSCPPDARCLNCMPDPKDPEGEDYECWAVKKPVTYTLSAYGKLEPGEEAMQREILARGPLVCGIACPDVFTFHYHSSKHNGIFIDKSGDTELDHDIEVVGWGVDEESGLKYWIARNSWGTYWGELGFFKVQRGVNALQLESGDCWYADPVYDVENAVVDGDFEGSMDGLRRPKSKKKKPTQQQQQQQQEEEGDSSVQAVAAAQRAVLARLQRVAAGSAQAGGGVLQRMAASVLAWAGKGQSDGNSDASVVAVA